MDDLKPTSEAEEILLRWAQGRAYRILPRVWREDMMAGLDVDKKTAGLDPVDLIEGGEPPIGTRTIQGIQESEARLFAFRRDVLLPQGIVRYGFVDYGKVSGPDKLTRDFIRENIYSHYFGWHFGNPQENWRDEKYTFDARRKDSLIGGLMTIRHECGRYSPNGKMSLREENDHPVLQAIAPYIEWGGSFGEEKLLTPGLEATMVKLIRSFNKSTKAFSV